jgi:glycosyltransferase involved in cell wall biosynthesis
MNHYSAVILTLNEEKALPGCLASLSACDDIVILDSGSKDRTVPIASAAGARIFTRPFDTFAGQRNYAQARIPFRNKWVLHIDADERMTPELDSECRAAVHRTDVNGLRIAPKMMWEGRWVRHCTDYPAYQARLVSAPEFEFVQVGHGQREAPDMKVANLQSNYLHDMSIYGRDNWLEKHRRYAHAEAIRVISDSGDERASDLLSGNPIKRRRALKKLSFKLPLRPLARFAYQYGLRRGFLDGAQGLDYCLLLSRYEGFIAAEIRKLKSKSGTQ